MTATQAQDPAQVAIRTITAGDAASKLAMEHRLAQDGRGMVLDTSQLPMLEDERARITQGLTTPDAQREWVAVGHDGNVLGHAQLRRLHPARCQHVGWLSLGVHPDWQGRGIGRLLMQTLLEAAPAMGLRRLELYVRADNPRAISLYAALGFHHEGTRRDFVRLNDGGFIDDLIMVRFLMRPVGAQ